jgi:osmoprotectant transport system permease protein
VNWVSANWALIWQRCVQHLQLALPAIVASFVLALPVGFVAARYRWLRSALLISSGLLYAIPSLPLFITLPTILGTSLRSPINVVIALTIYGFALMVRRRQTLWTRLILR